MFPNLYFYLAGAVLLAAPCFSQAPNPAGQNSSVSIRSVQTVFVSSFGRSDEAERFRLVLPERIEKAGFKVVETESQADAVLSGIVTFEVYGEGAKATVTAVLKSRAGDRLWSDTHRTGTRKHKDTLQMAADGIGEKIAKAKRGK